MKALGSMAAASGDLIALLSVGRRLFQTGSWEPSRSRFPWGGGVVFGQTGGKLLGTEGGRFRRPLIAS